jgi:S-DNA-T family DNA segregation ATPase FtsK/SpoIIIE
MCRVPMLSLSVNDETVGQLLDSMHNLGNWVVNYDDLLHRKLLQQKGIRIIRYKQSSTQGKNLIISSRAKDGMLRAELRKISSKLLPDLDTDQLRELVDRLIAEANDISGNLVLRAIRRSENAKELMGLVLSKYLLQNEVGANRYYGWFLLDDYATWLGEEEIADILCLSPGTDEEGQCVLHIITTEVKFVESLSVSKKAKDSENQLKQTLSRLESGFRKENTSLDAGIWRARISDMIVDGIDTPAVAKFDAAEWRRKVRSGACATRVRGYSHVFDSGPEQTSYDEPQAITDTENGFQEKFSLHQTSAFLRAFFNRSEPARTPPHSSKPKPPGEENGSAGFPFPPSPTPQPPEPPPEGGSAQGCESGSKVATLGEMLEGGDALVALFNNFPDTTPDDEATNAWVESTTVATRRALTSYGMPCELAAQPILTPNSLLLCFKGSDKLTAGSFEKKRSELLTTHGLKVVTVRAAAGAVRIYLERPNRQVVPMAGIWKPWISTVGDNGNTNLLIAVKEEDCSAVYLNPIKQSPHTLIAGTSGSGKSVLMQSLLLGIMATNTPSKAKIILIDPKQGSDYGPLRNMPHIGNIITDTESALAEIMALVSEMNHRYQLMAQHNVNHIDLYNREALDKLPYIWLVHDEFALWMQHKQYREQVVSLGNQLAIMARAAGIFLIFAAQRPSVDVMPMQMRDNLDNRLILRVAQDGTSEFCLGETGAEKLLMRGQMLARLGGEEPILCQVPYASIAELKAICDALIVRYS